MPLRSAWIRLLPVVTCVLALPACGPAPTPGLSPVPAQGPPATPVRPRDPVPGLQCCGGADAATGSVAAYAEWSRLATLERRGSGGDERTARPTAGRWDVPPPPSQPVPIPSALPATIGEVRTRLAELEMVPTRSAGEMFFRGWATIAGVELGLLAVTAMAPSSFTGWSFDRGFIKSGMEHFSEAWTQPPVWDTDHWFHNYIGHPYGGSVYYNTVRSQGAGRGTSFLFAGTMSMWWEYIFEAMAERPSIQDIVITPVVGSVLGELVHRATVGMRSNGTSPLEKAFILVLNPTHLLMNGWNGPWRPN